MIGTIREDLGKEVTALRAGFSEAPDLAILANGELEVLLEIAAGFTNKEIADRLGLGVRAVEAHRERLMLKLKVFGAARLTQFAVSGGLVAVD